MKSPRLAVSRYACFQTLKTDWQRLLLESSSNSIFLTWEWQDVWWRTLGEGELHLLAVEVEDELVGIAPLVRTGRRWGFSGGDEVADFLDVIARPADASAVAAAVLDHLEAFGGELVLRNLRPNAVAATALVEAARQRGLSPILEQEDVSPRVILPADWELYLQGLTKKDRHELRRKLRRLMESGEVQYKAVELGCIGPRDLADFARLHRLSGDRKAAFMSSEMEQFFGAMLAELAPRGWPRLYFLTIDGVRVAAVILFDYADEFLLYNSGYDPAYAHLSVGLLLKAFCLRDAIDEQRRAFDFLQGNEPYKYDLGGVDTPIYRLRIDLAGRRVHPVGESNGVARAGDHV